MNAGRAAHVVRGFAMLDLLVTFPLALPGWANVFFDLLYRATEIVGPVGVRFGFSELAWLFVHLSGVLGVLWALARLATPTRFLAALDAAGRCAVAVLLVRALQEGAPAGLWLFVATELAGAVAQGAVVLRERV
ncbi:MAG TPA: hypothetical protein VMW35_06230 [Myxococcota bacterium]|nr:hypothetical protein [Myxococcota bacterium]